MEVASLSSASNFGPLEEMSSFEAWAESQQHTGATRDGQCVSALTKRRYFKLETVNSKSIFLEFI